MREVSVKGSYPPLKRRCIALTVAAAMLAGGVALTASAEPACAVGSSHAGWTQTKSGKAYYRDGVRLTGLQKIGHHRYYFNGKGLLKTKKTTAKGVTYYPNAKGQLKAVGYGGHYYYAQNLRRMTKADAYDLKTTLLADKALSKVTNKGDSKSTKLRKAFKFVMKSPYGIHRTFNPFKKNWTAVYARDKIVGKSGDCHADGAAFAYLANAAGYKADVCLDAVRTGTGSSHCWTMIGRKVYDPLFAESKSYHQYYGATSGIYETNPVKRYRVPYYSYKHAKSSAPTIKSVLKEKNRYGLVKEAGAYRFYQDGAPLAGVWKTVEGKRYYFKRNGEAASSGSVRIKGTYYVFNEKAQLVKPVSVSVVTVAGAQYWVDPSGKAMRGWNTDHTKYYLKSGQLACGVRLVGKKLYASDVATGVYDQALTEQLRAADVKGQPAASLRELLGKPERAIYQDSCEEPGKEGLLIYERITVSTFTPTDTGVETLKSIAVR